MKWSLSALVLGLVVVFGASEADARNFRASQVPHSGGCALCHLFPGGPRTPLGIDVGRNLVGGNASWRRIFDLDSDGDGFTNGEELGDENGNWAQGDADPSRRSDPNQEFGVPSPSGTAPTASPFALMLLEDEVFEGELPFDDPDGNNTHRVRIIEPPTLGEVEFVDRATGAFTYTPPRNASGTDRFTWRVFDGSNLSEIAEVTIDIEAVNDAPIFDPPLRDRIVVREGGTVLFNTAADDVEDGPLDITHGPLPEGATFENNSFRWITETGQDGIYEVTFRTEDSEGLAVEGTVQIEVTEVNNAPTVSLTGPQEGEEGDALTFDVAFEDPDGDALSVTWSLDGEETEADEDLTEITHTFVQDGTFRLSVTVSDGSFDDTATISIDIENVTPTVAAGDDVSAEVGEEISFEGDFDDPGDEGLHTITWDFGDGAPEVEGELSTTHAYDSSGTFIATLSVADDSSRSLDTLTVTIGGGDEPGEDVGMMPDTGMTPDEDCSPGASVSCLCSNGAIGGTTCGLDGTPGVCSCGGGGGGDTGGCQSTPGQSSPSNAIFVLLALLAFTHRRS